MAKSSIDEAVNKLNIDGMNKVAYYAQDLSKIPQYQREDTSLPQITKTDTIPDEPQEPSEGEWWSIIRCP